MQNKKGQITLLLFFFVAAALTIMLILGITAWTAKIVDDELRSFDFEIGNISWNETYNQSTGRVLKAASTTSPQMISVGLLIGMILIMMFIGYHSDIKNKLWIMLDVGVMIIVEIFAGIIASSFTSLMNITPELLDVYSTTLSAGSKFVLNLPVIVPIVGVIIMIVTHIVSRIKRREDVAKF
ncbi:hypothetical protein LCGC14_1629610 [marine sediment metagenome]|uniref:Uncharacterized protein n=1 Tax=marine sediment metagenome TaxID=412755 RepID=A0A0F9I3F2_9ZZZZ